MPHEYKVKLYVQAKGSDEAVLAMSTDDMDGPSAWICFNSWTVIGDGCELRIYKDDVFLDFRDKDIR